MVGMPKFGSYGRLGNQLFQWQFLATMAKKLNTELVLPKWEYAEYFENPPKVGECSGTLIEEPHYRYDPKHYEKLDPSKNYNFLGYWQHDEYGETGIRFKEEYRNNIRDRFFYELSKPTIAIGIRRTDYLQEPRVYHQLPVHYYISALTNHFQDWRDHNLVFISDDINYCKLHFGCLPNALFPEVKDIDAMCLMSLCDNIIMANSTFYYWAGKLGEAKKIIQPTKLFAGSLLEKYGDINFYRSDTGDRWKQHEECKIDLRDVTFTIPVFYDHQDRKTNINRAIFQLQQYFDTNIIVGENAGSEFHYTKDYGQYIRFDYPSFHRTRMLNEMAKQATTPFIANWDADIVIPPMQVFETVSKLRSGTEMCYPYSGIFNRLTKKQAARMKDDIGVFASDPPNGTPSFGGAVMWNKDSFMRIGMENEYMISFAPEDVERFERATTLGLRIHRVPGDLYHFEHFCGPNSSTRNPNFKDNRALLHFQRQMTKQGLHEYIQSWPWHSPYTASYYETITEDAIRSRDEVFRILGVPEDASIIDCGCGVGQWGVGVRTYTGVDWQVPRDKLLIETYIDHDLREPFRNHDNKFDICLCLEVAEHIDEKYSEILIDTLCNLSDAIIFSAAIPYQGGNNHVNEQFQSYWIEKFEARGMKCFYSQEIRESKEVCLWYRQNLMVVLSSQSYSQENPYHRRLVPATDFVLPEYYEQITRELAR